MQIHIQQFLAIGVKSGNKILLNKIIGELLAEENDDGDPLYNAEFVLSCVILCNEKEIVWYQKMIELGFPEKIKEDLLEDIETRLGNGRITEKTARKLEFLVETAL